MIVPFYLAVQFLTVIPVPALPGDETSHMERALPWFPLVGGLLGLALALVDRVSANILTLAMRDGLLLALGALLTGMLHLDGFADCCDGLLGTRTVERRLEIMRDSRVGAYGVIGIGLLLLLLFAALGALPTAWRAFALIAAPALGRWSMALAILRWPYARAAGAGSAFRARPRHLLAATFMLIAVLAVAAFVLRLPPLPILALALVVPLVTLAWGAWASRRLGGGLTGDTYGALNEVVELAVLVLVPVVAR